MKSITLQIWVADNTDTTDLKTVVLENMTSVVKPLSDEEIAKIADGNAQRAYYATVRGFVNDLKDEITAGNIADENEAREWLEQSIDGCHDVIYTHAAQEVLRHSSNDQAYFDDFGTEGAMDDSGIQWSKLAYCALLADVYEELGDMDELFNAEETEEAEA
jgi:hypothetical protein